MENLSRQEIIKNTFDEMPREFSSHEFVQGLVKNGLEYKNIKTYMYQEFLINNCLRYSKKIWKKIPLTMNEQMEEHRDQFSGQTSNDTPLFTTIAPINNGIPWIGPGYTGSAPPSNTFSVTNTEEGKIEAAITLLKKHGYKIYKVREEEI